MAKVIGDSAGVDAATLSRWLAERELAVIDQHEYVALQAARWERQALLDGLRAHGVNLVPLTIDGAEGWTWRLVAAMPPAALLVAPRPYRLLRPVVYAALTELRGLREKD